jgi:hypothetical protein
LRCASALQIFSRAFARGQIRSKRLTGYGKIVSGNRRRRIARPQGGPSMDGVAAERKTGLIEREPVQAIGIGAKRRRLNHAYGSPRKPIAAQIARLAQLAGADHRAQSRTKIFFEFFVEFDSHPLHHLADIRGISSKSIEITHLRSALRPESLFERAIIILGRFASVLDLEQSMI